MPEPSRGTGGRLPRPLLEPPKPAPEFRSSFNRKCPDLTFAASKLFCRNNLDGSTSALLRADLTLKHVRI